MVWHWSFSAAAAAAAVHTATRYVTYTTGRIENLLGKMEV